MSRRRDPVTGASSSGCTERRTRCPSRTSCRRDASSTRWAFPTDQLWLGTLEGALAFCTRCQERPDEHWYQHVAEGVATVDIDCTLLQDMTVHQPHRSGPALSAFLCARGVDGLPALERQLVALHDTGVDDIMVAYSSPMPFPTADFPWVRVVQLDREEDPLPLIHLLNNEDVLLLDPEVVLSSATVFSLHQKFTQRRNCIHGLFGYDQKTSALSVGNETDIVHPRCLMVRRPYVALALAMQHLAPDCPPHLLLTKVVALAGGQRHRLHPDLAAGAGPLPPAQRLDAGLQASWRELCRQSVKWTPFLQQYRHFLP